MQKRLPPWVRRGLTTDRDFSRVHHLVGGLRLHTVCEEARCPNRHECWNAGTATVMILGDTCTRSCGFCSVKSGRPGALDLDEPRRVASAAREMGLKHIVITSVNRDDQRDGGSGIFAETIRSIREALPDCAVEVLTPDFEGVGDSIAAVLRAGPAVFSHNLETVRRLQAVIRPQANYGRSLGVLRMAAEWRSPPVEVKSGIMLGLGETEVEVLEALRDLYDSGVRIVTVGQYLRADPKLREVARYVEPAEFDRYAAAAREMGFHGVASGWNVRSSYKAEELYASARAARTGGNP